MNYAKHFSTVKTPQSKPIPGKVMVPNSAGGFVFAIDDWKRLDRFLILGNEGSTYYASEKKLTVENASCVLRCAQADIKRTVDTIVAVSDSGRAPKNDPAIFALAICAGLKGEPGRYALDNLSKVCRIGTHLFQFVEAVEQFRGHGRALNTALKRWYTEKDPKSLAYQLVKYQQRNGWSHKDVLRLCKPKLQGISSTCARWAVGKFRADETLQDALPDVILGTELAKNPHCDSKQIAQLIRQYNLPRECVPTEHLNSPEVWDALLEKMPLTALIRNLGKMSAVGLLKPMSEAVKTVNDKLADQEHLRKSRVHPIAVLLALKVYATGHGEKGKLTWTPVSQVVDQLNDTFYLAFPNVEPTGKRRHLALDVSGSMSSGGIAGTSLTPREAVAALALIVARTEPQHVITAFSNRFMELSISPRERLDDVMAKTSNLPFMGTDCSLPMLWASQHRIECDSFEIYTDNETWAGQVHPIQALNAYRKEFGIDAKLVVNGMTATNFSIADPNDFGCLDVVGFDAAAPAVVADFVRG
jgi:60 kDa SS-A/Ro ribonucleoprotein